MKIIVSGQASASHSETGEVVTDPEALQSLDGLRFDGDLCANYLFHDLLNDISIAGGAIQVAYHPERGLRVISEYWSPAALNADQLAELVKQTGGQWSDGIGEGCFDEWSQESGIDLDLAPYLLHGGDRPVADQVEDGRDAPRFAHLPKAVWKGNIELVQQAVAAGANLDAIYDGHTALLLAIQKGDAPTALLLIEGGADVNRPSVIGATPLIACASLNPADALSVATALFAKGADASVVDLMGNTALAEAQNNNNPELAALLVSHGAT